MKTTYFLVFFVLCLGKSLFGQYKEIEGRVVNKKSNEAIPFANIYNKSLKKGTISNYDGYFRIPITSLRDSVQISFIGFDQEFIELRDNIEFYTIYLEEKLFLLGELTITAKDNSYLYELVQKCRRSIPNIQQRSKAYYELKSFVDQKQIELVEGYYNVDVKGYKVMDLHLKAGRIALQSYENRFFTSLGSSRAIIMLDLLNGTQYFPKNPLELSGPKLKKSYYLTLNNKYLEGPSDSVYVIDYKPKDNLGLFFEGKLWINITKNQLIKITLNCNNALKHPFLPLFPTDKISKISFNITQTYKTSNSHQAVFNHTDFIYKIDYKSRIGKAEEQNFSTETDVVLHIYEYNRSFFQPIFYFSSNAIDDYRKINAQPYNEFFWNYNDEFRLNDSINANEIYFSDANTLTNKTLFKSNNFSKLGLFEHPYVEWSKTRIKFQEVFSDTTAKTSTNFQSESYKLSVKIFLDINSYGNSTDILTATIFNPYESFYYLPMDNKTHCFVNMFFDLCEIDRRELEEKLNAEKDNFTRVGQIYTAFYKDFEVKKYEYLKALQRGTNKAEMLKYNDYIYEKLGIDNIEIFQLFKSEE